MMDHTSSTPLMIVFVHTSNTVSLRKVVTSDLTSMHGYDLGTENIIDSPYGKLTQIPANMESLVLATSSVALLNPTNPYNNITSIIILNHV